MIRNWFKIALRNIKRYYVYSIVNVIGMAIGMASVVLILLWVQNELSYDRFHKNADCLYRVLENQYSDGGEIVQTALTPNALAPALKREYPEIIRSARYEGRACPIQKSDDYIMEAGAFVDKDFLEMFNIKFVCGDINSALNGPHDMVITEEMSRKFFGNENPLGKTLTILKSFVFTITGIVKSLPHNSHIQFDFLIPFEFYSELGADLNEWKYNATYTYIELQAGTDSKIVDNKIRDILKIKAKVSREDIFLQNIKKIHLYSYGKYNADISGHGDIAYIRILSIIAAFILIIACINFMNLSTAQSARRAKEIGVRKVAGANKRKIIFQFLGESLMIVFVAHIIAMILVEFLLPGFNRLIQNYQSSDLLMMNFNNQIGKQVEVNYHSAGLYIGLIAVILFCGLMAGGYPALYLSSLKPLDTMKGFINKNPGNAGFRRVLVISQFSLSVLLIICTLIVGKQLKYMQNMKLGFNKENIGYFQFSYDMKREVLKRDLYNNPDIITVTIADNPFTGMGPGTSDGFNWKGKQEGNNVLFSMMYTDEDYAKTFLLNLKEGRFFSSEFSDDKSTVVINEKAAEIMGFSNPIGEIISSGDGSKFRIVGVVKDFHFKSLHAKIDPLIIFMYKDGFNCFIRMKADKTASIIDYVRKTFKSYDVPYSLVFKFFEDDYNNLYWREQRMGKIFGYFSFLAIIISCLGLIGLSSFMAERRTKEIGIRKINGAKSLEIFVLLSKEYVLWVFISIIIASPLAWYAMHKWLQNFAYRINISLWVFVVADALALLIALLTVSFQSYKAAGKNPVEALRYE
jgi:putative ABC transport system permease protein